MKTTQWFMVALVTLSSLPVVAQQVGASAQQGTSATAGSSSLNQSSSANAGASRNGKQVQAQGSANAEGASTMEMRPINGELVGKLDSKSAKVGDPVVVKTVESARSTDGTEIPKGSRIEGHVTEVQAHSKTQQDGHMAIQFDRAELKDGRSVPIRSVIQSVSPSKAALAAAANGNTDDQMYAGANSPMGPMAGGGRAGGSALGGVAGAAGGLAGGAAGSVNSAAGSTLNGMGNAAGNVGATAGGLSGTVAGAGSMGAHATAIPGVMLANNLSGATSSTLSATKNNVHLDSGTQVVLAVAAAASH